MSVIKRFIDFINQDVKNENESKKLALVIRLICLSSCFYFVILMGLFLYVGDIIQTLFSICCFGVFGVVFSLTYHSRKSFKGLWFLNIAYVTWIISCVILLGWGIGVQHYLLVLVVLYFFSSYNRESEKILFAVAMFAIRLWLYFYCRNHAPFLMLNDVLTDGVQVVNSVMIFLQISIIAFVFSGNSMELETKLVRYNEKLKNQAETDALTELCNRRRAMDYLQGLEKNLPNMGQTFSIAIGDIDFFKKVNDNYGHECGDMILCQISGVMKEFMKKCGIAARWGGEEFILVFEEKNGDEAHELLLDLYQKIKKLSVDYRGETIKVTMTFGLAEYSNVNGIESAIREADEKLYQGKNSGRNKIVY